MSSVIYVVFVDRCVLLKVDRLLTKASEVIIELLDLCPKVSGNLSSELVVSPSQLPELCLEILHLVIEGCLKLVDVCLKLVDGYLKLVDDFLDVGEISGVLGNVFLELVKLSHHNTPAFGQAFLDLRDLGTQVGDRDVLVGHVRDGRDGRDHAKNSFEHAFAFVMS